MSDLIQKEGFSFAFAPDSCRECGGFCCIGESGYIFLNRAEIEAMSALLGLEVAEFGARFLRKVGYRYSLLEKPEAKGRGWACIFFDEAQGGCAVYEARPRQCREFPFWESNRNKTFHEVKEQCPFLKPL